MLLLLSNRIALPRRSFHVRFYTAAQQPVRVRFAPSPTGYLHLGGLRTALFNYLLAKKTGGDFILRIEDTDQNRLVKGATEKLISVLSWAGVKADEGPSSGGSCGPYIQSERTDIYREHAKQLVQSGHAYRCFCTPERIDRIRKVGLKHGNQIGYDRHCAHLTDKEINDNLEKGLSYTVRMRTPEGETKVDDMVHGTVRFSNRQLDDGILLKSDGYPTYHLANVVDDHMMGITHVLRGDEWLPSTPKHIILYNAFGWKAPRFVHLPLLMKPGGGKLSKRENDAFVEHYINKGYFPEALNNFVALLGWSPPTGESEIITSMDALVEKFDVSSLNDSQAVVDADKLGWINKQHLLKRAETKEGVLSMANYLQPIVHNTFSRRLHDADPEHKHIYRLETGYIAKVIDAVKERIRLIHDVPELCEYFFIQPDYTSDDANTLKKKLKAKPKEIVFSDAARQGLEALQDFDSTAINKYWQELAASHNVNYNRIMPVLRFAMTGKGVGTSIPLTMEVLGKSTCVERLGRAHSNLSLFPFATNMKTVTCTAPVNIAVIKYWGKRDTELILPTNDSLSVTLSQDILHSKTTISASQDYTQDRLWLNGKEEDITKNRRMHNCFRETRALRQKMEETDGSLEKLSTYKVHVCSENNFPTAAGLASSASGLAALVYTLSKLFDLNVSVSDLSRIARQGSGSACRSLFGGFVAWEKGEAKDGSDSRAVQVAPETHWPELEALVCVVSDAKKGTSSTEGMQHTVETSTLMQERINKVVPERMEAMKKAILDRDFQSFAEITMRDSNQFHAVCLDTYPPIFYLNDTSRAIIRLVHAYNSTSPDGKLKAAYTYDAGPNAVIYAPKENMREIIQLIAHYFPGQSSTYFTDPYNVIAGATLGEDFVPKGHAAFNENVIPVFAPGSVSRLLHTKTHDGPRVLTSEEDSLLNAEGLPKRTV